MPVFLACVAATEAGLSARYEQELEFTYLIGISVGAAQVLVVLEGPILGVAADETLLGTAANE